MFSEFAEMVERNCCFSWRTVLGKDNEELARSVDSVVFTMNDYGDAWGFSFALRFRGRWHQSKLSVEPFDYDIFAPNESGQNRSPSNIASDVSYELVEKVVREIAG